MTQATSELAPSDISPRRQHVSALLLRLVHAYQRFISPVTGDCCRFEPSCSRYCDLCLKYHSPSRALWLTLKRLLRCNPLFAPGFDPPPLPANAPAELSEPNWARINQLYSVNQEAEPSIPPIAGSLHAEPMRPVAANSQEAPTP